MRDPETKAGITIYEGRHTTIDIEDIEEFIDVAYEALDLLEEVEWDDYDEPQCQWCHQPNDRDEPHYRDCPWLLLMQKAGRR